MPTALFRIKEQESPMKLSHLLSMVSLLVLGTSLALADSPGKKEDFTGNYFASLPERARSSNSTRTAPRG
jgi:hypothetical protein